MGSIVVMTALHQLIDFVLPPRCIVTGEIVDQQGVLSPTAWRELNFIAKPQCVRCGIPFEFIEEADIQEDSTQGSVCAGCMKYPPLYRMARSALVYDDASRDIVLGFKHGDQIHAAPCFVPWLERAGADILEHADFLVPIPLHRWRLLRRRFNQSAVMTQHLSKSSKIPFILNALERVRATPVQGYLQPKERKKNVKNAFAVPEGIIPKIRNKHIVLIDDVYTTGATVSECAKALLKNGAGTVDVLTLARVVKPTRF